jgi:ubiquitin-protein ligase E3 C
MYQSFTGASRRPRQVNLSGKNANPFAASNPLGGPQSAVQNAHQDRQQRQKQRQELNAAKTLQRVWRGHSARTKTRDEWRTQWDATSCSNLDAVARLNALLLFFSPSNHGDVHRLISFVSDHSLDTTASRYHLRLENACLDALAQPKPHRVNDLLTVLSFLATAIPHETARISNRYYTTLSKLQQSTHTSFQQALVAPLSSNLPAAYQGFAAAYLTTPLETTTLDHLAATLDFSLLAQAISNISTTQTLDTRRCLWLLGQFIYLKPHSIRTSHYVPVVAHMLSSLAETIAPEAPALDMTNKDYDQQVLATNPTRVQLNSFLRDQLSRLVDRDAISSLVPRPTTNTSTLEDTSDSQLLASYALILLRIFPLRADDIRMWLYVGPLDQAYREDTIPAITFFWKGMRSTSIFTSIHKDPRAAVELLRAPKSSVSAWKPPGYEAEHSKRNEEWRVVLVFLELYTFVLKITDDEEFLGTNSGTNLRESKNALPIEDLKDLTIFLKNMGFSMYFNSQEISESFEPSLETLSTANLSRHFGGKLTTVETKAEATPQTISVAGTVGMSLDYVKGLVTGLLRAVYDRDSRRNFLPKGHWLMTSRLDMTNFITAVVSEDERRQQLQLQAREEDGEPDEPNAEWDEAESNSMTPSQRNYQRSNRQLSTVRYLQSVAPRLEILQNMPFMIPFETRVEIFRQFVSLDMIKRRHGHTDPDLWRHRMAFGSIGGHDSSELGRHHASIRRKNEFEDAFKQFYSLGDGLKEPIQITFLDEFGLQEAGIDGGGVTKEFLTSITTEAFNPEKLMFAENSQHALYPSPTSVEVHKEMLRLIGYSDDSEEHREAVRDLLQRYEFLGRVVGKCLYEGILIDINFASFFLSKWALFGGHNNASKESGYKASVNELRDLDEELYQGLMSLKHYPGDVAEWGTYFAVNNTITLPNGQTKTVEHQLIANGANTLVNRGNRLVYIAKVAQYRLSGQSHLQTTAFLTGLSSIIQPSWLNMFNQKELQTLIGGAASNIDVSDLRANTQYNGVYEIGTDGQEHPSVQLFWQIMLELPDVERRKVLKFVTSTPRAPLLGFGSLNPRFTIRDSGDDEHRFPTASTCVNLLKLPRFRSKEALRDKLLYAVNSGAGFDLS